MGRRRFITILLAIWLVSLVLRATAIYGGWRHPAIWVLPFLRPESVLIGVLLATAGPKRLPAPTLLVLGAAILAAGLGLLPGVGSGWFDMLLYPMVALLFGAVLWMALTIPRMAALLSIEPLRYLGRISFGLYVYHLAAIAVGRRLSSELGGPDWVSPAIALVITIGVSAASYQWIERPFLRKKERLAAVSSAPV